jgi:F-type H+-transporting ATPase subunit delta
LRSESVALNYAEALFALGEQSGQTAEYADRLDALAGAVATSPLVHAVLMSPKVAKSVKIRLLTEGMAGAPQEFLLFLQAVVKRGRQGLLGEVSAAYLGLLDLKLNRVRAGVTVAREPDAAMQKEIIKALEARIGKEVLASFTVDPEILGGVVVRVGDRVLDGSVKRKLTRLRRQLLSR